MSRSLGKSLTGRGLASKVAGPTAFDTARYPAYNDRQSAYNVEGWDMKETIRIDTKCKRLNKGIEGSIIKVQWESPSGIIFTSEYRIGGEHIQTAINYVPNR